MEIRNGVKKVKIEPKYPGVPHDVVVKMRERYKRVYPLILARSIERAKSPGELYDILESLPKELPLLWDEDGRRWVVTDDLTCSKDFEFQEIE